jgi:hypothetical protein
MELAEFKGEGGRVLRVGGIAGRGKRGLGKIGK